MWRKNDNLINPVIARDIRFLISKYSKDTPREVSPSIPDLTRFERRLPRTQEKPRSSHKELPDIYSEHNAYEWFMKNAGLDTH